MKKRFLIEAVSPKGVKMWFNVDTENFASAEYHALQIYPGYCIMKIELTGHYIDGFLFGINGCPTV